MTARLSYKICPLNELNHEEVNALHRLTLNGDHSTMRFYLQLQQRLTVKGYAVMAFSKGQLVGWSLVFRRKAIFSIYAKLHVFVDPELRRRGIGTRLVRKATQVASTSWSNAMLTVSPWDAISQEFFSAIKVAS